MISKHMQQIANDLHFDLHACEPNDPHDRGNPQEKGIVERFFRTLNTRLWATLAGYTHSTTSKRHPKAHAELTITQLAEKFWEFINNEYHCETHSETHETPLEFWAKHCHAAGHVSPRELDILLQAVEYRVLIKAGIKYAGRIYWHEDLYEDIPVGDQVMIRAQPRYMKPDEIQVFYENRWICSAFAHDSKVGREVTGERVLLAQRRQKKHIDLLIKKKKIVLERVEQEITARRQMEEQNSSADASNRAGPSTLSRAGRSFRKWTGKRFFVISRKKTLGSVLAQYTAGTDAKGDDLGHNACRDETAKTGEGVEYGKPDGAEHRF